MNTSEAISQFGSVRALARALGVSVQAVYGWGESPPPLRQYQIKELLAQRDIAGDSSIVMREEEASTDAA